MDDVVAAAGVLFPEKQRDLASFLLIKCVLCRCDKQLRWCRLAWMPIASDQNIMLIDQGVKGNEDNYNNYHRMMHHTTFELLPLAFPTCGNSETTTVDGVTHG